MCVGWSLCRVQAPRKLTCASSWCCVLRTTKAPPGLVAELVKCERATVVVTEAPVSTRYATSISGLHRSRSSSSCQAPFLPRLRHHLIPRHSEADQVQARDSADCDYGVDQVSTQFFRASSSAFRRPRSIPYCTSSSTPHRSTTTRSSHSSPSCGLAVSTDCRE